MSVNITVVVKDIVDNLLPGILRIEPVQVAGSTIVNQILEVVSTGSTVVSVPASVSAKYYYTPSLSDDLGFYIGTLTPASSGDFGTLIRQAALYSVGAHIYRVASGSFKATNDIPSQNVNATISSTAILKNGIIVVPFETSILKIDGTYLVSLPQSADFYSPQGDSPKFRLVFNDLRIGASDMSIPSSDNLKFTTSGTSVILST